MSESTAAIFAAFIGAGAALLAGGFAFLAALKQVTKTATTQRDQAFWDSRRDTYAKALVTAANFQRVSDECAHALVSTSGLQDELARRLDDAAHDFETARAVLCLQAPDGHGVANAISVTHSYLWEACKIIELWAAGEVNQYQSWESRLEDTLSTLNEVVSSLAEALRADLHREVDV
ncbi:hypothetical protein [Actinacidiphila glaucinigra]|uniref:hypothetical protein n=1 Tax=Actinacidiphila glaucinigra TaxID=235986 RepID=UPI003D8EE96C